MIRPRALLTVAALALTAAVSACGGSGTTPAGNGPAPGITPTASGSGSAGAAAGPITVLAAASLKEAFTTIGQGFEAANPGAEVRFGFGPSSGLAAQITQGAPADVFVSASAGNMEQVVAAGLAAAPRPFAKNVLQIAVPPQNPAGVRGLADLARPGVKVALCQPQVPCGTVATQVLSNAGLTLTPVTLEADVKATLTKVRLGEVDAGLVYVTDVRAGGDAVRGIDIPADVNASTTYPIAALGRSSQAATARAFVEYVLSPQGQAVLTRAGFAAP